MFLHSLWFDSFENCSHFLGSKQGMGLTVVGTPSSDDERVRCELLSRSHVPFGLKVEISLAATGLEYAKWNEWVLAPVSEQQLPAFHFSSECIEAVERLSALVGSLDKRLSVLEALVDSLDKRLSALERRFGS